MSTVLTAAAVSAVVGLLMPARRHLAWAGHAFVLVLVASASLILLTEALMLSGDLKTPLVTGTIATSLLLPAFWLARSAGAPPPDEHDDDFGDGGPGDPPGDPEPDPPASELDWDAFDEARRAWTGRERELVGAPHHGAGS
jgi:hypothetical protein